MLGLVLDIMEGFFFFVVQTEMNFLGQLRHPNLVKLIGYCCEDDHRLLVYEFMFRGSLENHLFRSTASFALLKQIFCWFECLL